MNIRPEDVTPLYDRLLVRPRFDETTRGGLVVPELHKKNVPYFLAEVVAAGHGRVTEDNKVVPLHVQVGSIVMVERKAGMPLPVEGETLLMISEMHVLAIVTVREEPRIVMVS